MKKFYLIVITIIISVAAIKSYGQETNVIDKNIPVKKISYVFFFEFGYSLNISFDNEFLLGVPGVFVNGIRFNKTQDEIGIGVGAEFLVFGKSFPVFVNYRHYFQSKTKLKPLINVAVGSQLSCPINLLDSQQSNNNNSLNKSYHLGLYSTIAGGFKYDAFSLSAGILIKSRDIDKYYSGVEIKLGYTF